MTCVKMETSVLRFGGSCSPNTKPGCIVCLSLSLVATAQRSFHVLNRARHSHCFDKPNDNTVNLRDRGRKGQYSRERSFLQDSITIREQSGDGVVLLLHVTTKEYNHQRRARTSARSVKTETRASERAEGQSFHFSFFFVFSFL